MFIGDGTYNGSSKINLNNLFANIQKTKIEPKRKNKSIMQQDNPPKSGQKGEKWNVLNRPSQSLNLKPVEHAFHFVKEAVVQDWKRITKEECTDLVM